MKKYFTFTLREIIQFSDCDGTNGRDGRGGGRAEEGKGLSETSLQSRDSSHLTTGAEGEISDQPDM